MISKKILIIEDEKILSELIGSKLGREGYQVLAAYNGEEGIKAIKRYKPDLILLDIVMPKKNGFEVLKEISKDNKLKHIPVIIISNSGQLIEINKAIKWGVKDWLIKTEFDPQEVVQKVKKALSNPT